MDNSKNDKDKGFFSSEIYQTSAKKRVLFFISLITLLILNLLWIGFIVYSVFGETTQQLKAMTGLLDYSALNKSEQNQFLKRIVKQDISIWPTSGVVLSGRTDHEVFVSLMENVLHKENEAEFNSLTAEGRELIKNAFYNVIEEINFRIKLENIVDAPRIRELAEGMTETNKISLAVDQIRFTRYHWLGFDKTLFYIVVSEPGVNTAYRVYFSAISDVAEKVYFLKKVYIPFLILLIFLFIIIGYSLFSYKKQAKLLSIESELQTATDFPSLVRILYTSIHGQNISRCSSTSLLFVRGASCTRFNFGENSETNTKIINLQHDSLTSKRITLLKQKAYDIFQFEGYLDSEVENYSLSIPLRRGEVVIGFINLNFIFPSFYHTNRLLSFTNSLIPVLQEVYNQLLNRILEVRERELEDYSNEIFSRTGLSPEELFQEVKRKLIADSSTTSAFLSPIELIEAFSIENSNKITCFERDEVAWNKGVEHHIQAAARQNDSSTFYYNEGIMELVLPLSISNDQKKILIFLRFTGETNNLSFLSIEFLETVFREFSSVVNEYSKKVSREIIRGELIEIATGIQPEVIEILSLKVTEFFENNSVDPMKSGAELKHLLRKKSSSFLELKTQAYGYQVEADLYMSSELQKYLNGNEDRSLYENSIKLLNKKMIGTFGENQKFVTQAKSGGDGDGLTFLVPALNSRKMNQLKLDTGTEISSIEKTFYDSLVLENTVHILKETYDLNIPFKFGIFHLDAKEKMDLSFEKGALKINSYLTGLVERARFEKGYRLTLSGETETQIGFEHGKNSLGEISKRIYQQFTVIAPENIIKAINNESGKEKLRVNEFFTTDYESKEKGKLKKYYEITLAYRFPFHNSVPYLTKLPYRWNSELAGKITQRLISYLTKNRSEDLRTILKDFSEEKTKSTISETDLAHFLSPVNREIIAPGLYMALEKKNLTDLNFQELINHLNHISEVIIPKLKLSENISQYLIKTEKDYFDSDKSMRSTILGEMNLNYSKYMSQIS